MGRAGSWLVTLIVPARLSADPGAMTSYERCDALVANNVAARRTPVRAASIRDRVHSGSQRRSTLAGWRGATVAFMASSLLLALVAAGIGGGAGVGSGPPP